MRLEHRALVLVLVLAACGGALRAQMAVCLASDLGPPTVDPVVIGGNVLLTAGCTLDFGPREVVLDGSCTLSVTTGTIRCARLSLLAGSQIQGPGATLTLESTNPGPHDGSITVEGTIDLSSAAGTGSLQITAGTGLAVLGAGKLDCRGLTANGSGGSITLAAQGNVVIDGSTTSVDTSSGSTGQGGDVSITTTAGDVEIKKRMRLDGGLFDAGWLDVTASGSIVTTGPITCDGGGTSANGFGTGGDATLIAGADISIGDDLFCRGASGNATTGGTDGGYMTLDAQGPIVIAADVRADGGFDEFGGYIEITCGGLFQQTSGLLDASGNGGEASGGNIDVFYGTLCNLFGNLDVQGTTNEFSEGGYVYVEGPGDLVTAGTIRAFGNTAGAVDLVSTAGSITHSGLMLVDGRNAFGYGGDVVISAVANAGGWASSLLLRSRRRMTCGRRSNAVGS